MSKQFTPISMRDGNGRPLIVFARGRTKYHAVTADPCVRLVTLETLRELTPLERRGEPYPPRRGASFWLNHSNFPITDRAKRVLRGLVSRKTVRS